ncbi:MAG: signal recognition particle receptor subunit alpha, partial [Actinomycetota bacterium]|nr:signal recognition particle receptor subunit alpha [Actinomycetota bacterium]
MEPVLLVLILVLVLVTSLAGVAATRRRGRGVELEPPPTETTRPVAPRRPTAGEPARDAPPTAAVDEPPVGDLAADAPPTGTGLEYDPELVDQIEQAFAEPEPEPEPEPEQEPEAAAPPAKPRFRDRLGKARALLAGYLGSVLSRTAIDDDTWDELEEALIRADVGVGLTTDLLDELRTRVKAERINTSEELLTALKGELKELLSQGDRTLRFDDGGPNVWLFVGVNGVGKTTTIGKLGKREADGGRAVVMAAGDTFRAAA